MQTPENHCTVCHCQTGGTKKNGRMTLHTKISVDDGSDWEASRAIHGPVLPLVGQEYAAAITFKYSLHITLPARVVLTSN